MRRFTLSVITISLLFALSACGSSQSGEKMDYKEVKSMVIDILKTEDGQKAIEEVTQKKEQEVENQSNVIQMPKTHEGQQIQMAVKQVLTDPGYPKILETMMTDPKFAGEFAKAVQKENKQLHKDLMKDPEYQKQLLELMKNKEFKEIIAEVMKSQDYRKQTMTIMQESLQSPLFKIELIDLMKKAMEEDSKPKKEGKKKDKEEENSSSSDSSST